MPTLEDCPDSEATLESTTVEVSEATVCDHPEFALATRIRRILVSYTLTTEDATDVHMFEFWTDEYDEDGYSAWDEFVTLITRDDNRDSLIFHVKRYGGVMSEFVDICTPNQQHSAAA